MSFWHYNTGGLLRRALGAHVASSGRVACFLIVISGLVKQTVTWVHMWHVGLNKSCAQADTSATHAVSDSYRRGFMAAIEPYPWLLPPPRHCLLHFETHAAMVLQTKCIYIYMATKLSRYFPHIALDETLLLT